jgi:hypothetical protein
MQHPRQTIPFSHILLPFLGLSLLSSCVVPIAFIGVVGAADVYATQEYRSNSTSMWLDYPAEDVSTRRSCSWKTWPHTGNPRPTNPHSRSVILP